MAVQVEYQSTKIGNFPASTCLVSRCTVEAIVPEERHQTVRELMKFSVLRMVRGGFQILGTIVRAITVQVMNDRLGVQADSSTPLVDETMLAHVPGCVCKMMVRHAKQNVAVLVDVDARDCGRRTLAGTWTISPTPGNESLQMVASDKSLMKAVVFSEFRARVGADGSTSPATTFTKPVWGRPAFGRLQTFCDLGGTSSFDPETGPQGQVVSLDIPRSLVLVVGLPRNGLPTAALADVGRMLGRHDRDYTTTFVTRPNEEV